MCIEHSMSCVCVLTDTCLRYLKVADLAALDAEYLEAYVQCLQSLLTGHRLIQHSVTQYEKVAKTSINNNVRSRIGLAHENY